MSLITLSASILTAEVIRVDASLRALLSQYVIKSID